MTQLASVLGHIRRLVGVRAVEAGTDAELLAQFVQTREEAAFARLVERHGPMVRAVCRRVLQHDADADDAFQATFLVLARKADAIRKYESVGSWLYGTAYRLALKMRAGVQKRQAREGSVPATPPETTAVSTTAPGLDQHELRALLDQELNLLPEKYRAPLVLCYLEGRTNEEAAQQLNWTKGTVSGRLARARDLLRARLARRGLALPAAALAATLSEQLAAGQVPRSLLETTTSAALAFVAHAGAVANISARAAALAEGALRTMWIAKLKVATVAIVVVAGLAAGIGSFSLRPHPLGVVAAPVGDLPEESMSKTEPASCPLQLRLVAQKRDYSLELPAGKTAAEYRKDLEAHQGDGAIHSVPKPPAVDLVLEFQNTGKEELTFHLGGNLRDYVAVPHLQGAGALSLVTRCKYLQREPRSPVAIRLAAGARHRLPVQQLRSGSEKEQQNTYWSAYWTTGGDYKVHFTVRTAVTPAPQGSKALDGNSGEVHLTSNSVTLSVREQAAGKTDPPGAPLELKLVAKKDTYTLDLGGKTAAAFRQHVSALQAQAEKLENGSFVLPGPAANYPAPPTVDLELELRNTGDQEIQYWKPDVDDDSAYVKFDLQGPDSLALDARQSVGILNAKQLKVATLPPGGLQRLKITSLRGGAEGLTYHYWLQTGEYTLRASIFTAVKPAPKGAQLVGEGREFGAVAVTSAPIKLQVVEQGKSNPPGVPLELKLVAKKDGATLDLGGKTPEEFRALLKKAESDRQDVPPASAADLTLEFRNTGSQEIRFWVGGDPTFYRLNVEGPGASSVLAQLRKTEEYLSPRVITLAPGKSHQIEQTDLSFGNMKEFHRAYWTTPGEYTLTAVYETAVSPRPANIKPVGEDFGRVTLTAPPIRIKVGEPAPQGKAEPTGVPLELKLTSKKDSYTLNLGGKTPAEFRKALKDAFQRGDPPPPAPEVDLELQIKNTSKEAVTFMVGGDSLTLNLQLDGPGAVSGPSGMNFTDVVRPGRLLTLKSGETHTLGWTRLTYGQRGASDVAFWTAPGEYRLTAIVKTSIPGPDSKSGQSQPIELTSAPVTVKVVEPKK